MSVLSSKTTDWLTLSNALLKVKGWFQTAQKRIIGCDRSVQTMFLSG
jgi:hypothetical protein